MGFFNEFLRRQVRFIDERTAVKSAVCRPLSDGLPIWLITPAAVLKNKQGESLHCAMQCGRL